ncbi:hypothetical protein [Kordia jejudonensis]|uniref:hypothetical protein n=1 Tax=Kordia jejudonensis TaxID=1348245 RepID=UPI000629A021|nr:hypothetical protein [Kordia jejudonensis]
MLKNILNLENARLLDKKEQKEILGGRNELTQADFDQCRLWTTNADGTGGSWSGYVTYAQASSEWNGTEYSDGSIATGYCCASCPF